jgi:hypothetical protein
MTHHPKRRGGQPKSAAQRKRNNLTFRTRDELRQRLETAAAVSGRSISEEIEYRLNRDFNWEATKGDVDKVRAEAAAIRSTAYVQALRLAGLTILRDIEARPRRVVIDLETLLAEADGIARGLRSGFVDEKAPPPRTPAELRRTVEEEQRLLEELADLRHRVEEMMEKTRAADAAAKSDDAAA